MAKWKNKLFWVIPLLIIAIIVGIYFFINQKHQQKNDNFFNQTTKDDGSYDQLDLFPELSSYDFYQYLEVNNGKPVIGQNFVTKVLKKVIDEVTIIDGTLKYEIITWTNSALTITFLLETNASQYWKTYYFNANL